MNKNQKNLFAGAVKMNADVLGTEEPKIIFRPKEFFFTPTTWAALGESGTSIVVNYNIDFDDKPDILLAISHEMRHLWQMQTGKISENYSPSDNSNLQKYNLQWEEIDANAWAVEMVEHFLKVTPLLEQTLGAEVWAKIRERQAEIRKGLIEEKIV